MVRIDGSDKLYSTYINIKEPYPIWLLISGIIILEKNKILMTHTYVHMKVYICMCMYVHVHTNICFIVHIDSLFTVYFERVSVRPFQ